MLAIWGPSGRSLISNIEFFFFLHIKHKSSLKAKQNICCCTIQLLLFEWICKCTISETITSPAPFDILFLRILHVSPSIWHCSPVIVCVCVCQNLQMYINIYTRDKCVCRQANLYLMGNLLVIHHLLILEDAITKTDVFAWLHLFFFQWWMGGIRFSGFC